MSLSEFPIVLKPSQPIVDQNGALVRPNGQVCADRAELTRAAHAWGGEPLLAQPLISGVGEGLFGIAGPTGLHAVSAHRRIRMMNPQGSGSSACSSAPVDPVLAAAAERMLGDAGWRGMYMLEFLRDSDGTPWFMELNGRPWGSMALARRSGLEYPAWAVRQLRDSEFEPAVTSFSGQTCRHLGRELVHVMMVMRGPRSVALTEWPSRSKAVREVLRFRRNDGWYNWRAGDRRVFVDETLRHRDQPAPAGVPMTSRVRVAAHVHSDWSYDGTWSLSKIATTFARLGYDAVLSPSTIAASMLIGGPGSGRPVATTAPRASCSSLASSTATRVIRFTSRCGATSHF